MKGTRLTEETAPFVKSGTHTSLQCVGHSPIERHCPALRPRRGELCLAQCGLDRTYSLVIPGAVYGWQRASDGFAQGLCRPEEMSSPKSLERLADPSFESQLSKRAQTLLT